MKTSAGDSSAKGEKEITRWKKKTGLIRIDEVKLQDWRFELFTKRYQTEFSVANFVLKAVDLKESIDVTVTVEIGSHSKSSKELSCTRSQRLSPEISSMTIYPKLFSSQLDALVQTNGSLVLFWQVKITNAIKKIKSDLKTDAFKTQSETLKPVLQCQKPKRVPQSEKEPSLPSASTNVILSEQKPQSPESATKPISSQQIKPAITQTPQKTEITQQHSLVKSLSSTLQPQRVPKQTSVSSPQPGTGAAVSIQQHTQAQTKRPEITQQQYVVKSLSQQVPANVKTQDKPENYIGLRNQGATCYMNSALQCLFHLKAFRRIVYMMPTETQNDSIPLNLQAMFYTMQTSRTPCSTKALTKSFGWTQDDAFVQHDIQEFLKILIDNIETKLSNTQHKTAIADLFKGKLVKYIRYKGLLNREHEEGFYDISLKVKDCESLVHSFAVFTAQEEIEDYNTGIPKVGIQTVQMGVELMELPPVLQIHLERFEFDLERFVPVKINTRFAFDVEIDLSDFLSPRANQKQVTKYALYSVIVHHGNGRGGHYYAYIRPNCKNDWYLFNDDIVKIVSEDEAVEGTYGGLNQKGKLRSESAYMLFYVRKDYINERGFPACDILDSVPKHVTEYAEKNAAEYAETRQQKVTLITDDSVKLNAANGKSGISNIRRNLTIGVNATCTAMQFYKELELNWKTSLRIWHLESSYMPRSVLPPDDRLIAKMRPLLFYCQMKDKQEELETTSNKILVFVKWFAISYPMVFVKSMIIYKNDAVSKTVDVLKSIMSVPKICRTRVYLENESSASEIDANKSWDYNGVASGSSIILQALDYAVPSEVIYRYIDREPAVQSNTIDYFSQQRVSPKNPIEYIEMKTNVRTMKLYYYQKPSVLWTNIIVPERISSRELNDLIRPYTEGRKFLLFGSNLDSKYPAPLPLTSVSRDMTDLYILFDAENDLNKRTIAIEYSDTRYNAGTIYCWYTRPNKLRDIKKALSLANVMAYSTRNSVIEKVYENDDIITSSHVFITSDVVDMKKAKQVVHVTVDQKGYFAPFGVPFFVEQMTGETAHVVWEMLQKIFNWSKEAATHFRLAVAETATCKFDQKILISRNHVFASNKNDIILLIHPCDSGYENVQQALKMYN